MTKRELKREIIEYLERHYPIDQIARALHVPHHIVAELSKYKHVHQ